MIFDELRKKPEKINETKQQQQKVQTRGLMLPFQSNGASRHSPPLFSLKPFSHDAICLVFRPPEGSGCGVEPTLHPGTTQREVSNLSLQEQQLLPRRRPGTAYGLE